VEPLAQQEPLARVVCVPRLWAVEGRLPSVQAAEPAEAVQAAGAVEAARPQQDQAL